MRWAFRGNGLLRGSPDSDGDTDVAIKCLNGQVVIKVQIRAELMFRYAGPDARGISHSVAGPPPLTCGYMWTCISHYLKGPLICGNVVIYIIFFVATVC